MAQVALLTKGIVYDTSRQVVTLHQVVERFMLGDSLCEKCIVTEIMFDEHAGYTYTLIGLKSLRNFRTRFIFDEHESASGFFADLAYPTFLAAEQVEEVIARAAAAEKQRREEAAIAQRRLHRGARRLFSEGPGHLYRRTFRCVGSGAYQGQAQLQSDLSGPQGRRLDLPEIPSGPTGGRHVVVIKFCKL